MIWKLILLSKVTFIINYSLNYLMGCYHLAYKSENDYNNEN